MAVFKPNNFYPYQQEVDMESLDGNVFSCQVNTDGGLVSAAKLKILSAIDNTELYENIYQFEYENSTLNGQNIVRTPYRNKEIAEMEILPYQIYPEMVTDENGNKSWILSHISFQSLCDKNAVYNDKKNMCPYNFYLVKKNKLSLFKIKAKLVDGDGNTFFEDIDFNNFQIISSDNSDNLFTIKFNDISIFENHYNLMKDEKTYIDVLYYVVLKNNYDYLWNVRLYEHYFDKYVDKGTLVTDGYITGSTKNVFWYNKDLQDNDEYEKFIKKDNYVEVIADETNSDIFTDQIIQGKTMSGSLLVNTDINPVEQQLLKSVKGRIFTKVLDDETKTICYTDKYEITESGQIIEKDISDTDQYNGNEGIWNLIYPNFKTNQKILSMTAIARGNYARVTPWQFIDNVLITINEDNKFVFDISESSLGNYVYTANGSHLDVYDTRVSFFADLYKYPFICYSCETHVIIREVFQETEEEIEKYAEVTDSQIEFINGKRFFIKVLTPAPLHKDFYGVSVYQAVSNPYVYYYIYSNNFINSSIENSDLYCFNNPNIFNAIISNSLKAYGYNSVYQGSQYFFVDFTSFDFLLTSSIKNKDEDTEEYTFRVCPNNNYSSTYTTKLRPAFKQTCDLNNNTNYVFSAKCYIGDRSNIHTMYITIDLYSYSDSTFHEQMTVFNYIDFSDSNYLHNCLYEFTIGPDEKNDIYAIISIECASNNDVYDFYISDIQLISKSNSYDTRIYLNQDTVNFSEILENMYIELKYHDSIIWDDFKYSFLEQNVQKIKKYDYYNKTFVLFDTQYQNMLIDFLNDPSIPEIIKDIQYKIIYKQREKIIWTTESLSFNKNINKIETQNEFKINLKNNANIYIYPSSDSNTYNSFFGPKDTNYNVENLYIRFPEYEGKDGTGNYIKNYNKYYDTKDLDTSIPYYEKRIVGTSVIYDVNNYKGNISGPFYNSQYYFSTSNGEKSNWDQTLCPLSLYGTKVNEDAFNDHISDEDGLLKGYYNKLFKVSSYDVNTGEFIIAGGLEREILSTDKYEIWKKESVEGSDNEYDITEIKSTYTRIYPVQNKIDEEIFIGTSNSLIPDGLKILNSTNSFVFIQPNSNFSSDSNTDPFLILDDTEMRLTFPYSHIVDTLKYKIINNTIDKLDNSQWLLKYNSSDQVDLIPGMTYKLYTDWADSVPSSYFYGRSLGDIQLKYGELSYVNSIRKPGEFSIENYNKLIDNLFDFDYYRQDNYCVISGMDIYMVANIKNITTQIKRYRYKIYNKDMELLWDSLDIWDNIVEYTIRGLENNEMYYLSLECEDEYGYQYVYETSFYSNYSVSYIPNNDIHIESICSQNAIKIEIDPIYFTDDQYRLEDIEEVFVFRKDSNKKIDYVNTINLYDDKVYTGQDNNDYKYGFIDYNVRSNEYYDYIFVFKINKNISDNFEEYQYVLSEISIKTNFDSWTIIDIIKNNDTGLYEVSGDVWCFRYNLETSDIVNNTSVASWDTLGRYAQMGTSEKSYDSSGLTCLLGDVSYYISYDGINNIKQYGYHEKIATSEKDMEFEYNNGKTNNIQKYQKWKKFCKTNNFKLLKDMAGNIWIVGISENPSASINNKTREQLKTISFQWKEIMDYSNISIVGKLEK